MRYLGTVAVAVAVSVVILVAWLLVDTWAQSRCQRVGATVRHIDRAWVCVTADGRIVEP